MDGWITFWGWSWKAGRRRKLIRSVKRLKGFLAAPITYGNPFPRALSSSLSLSSWANPKSQTLHAMHDDEGAVEAYDRRIDNSTFTNHGRSTLGLTGIYRDCPSIIIIHRVKAAVVLIAIEELNIHIHCCTLCDVKYAQTQLQTVFYYLCTRR